MANTNWFIGIDSGSSTPGGSQTPLANHVFIDNMYVGIEDGSPDAPYRDISTARSTEVGAKTFVIASGYYTDNSITFISGDVLKANVPGTVIFDGSGTFNSAAVLLETVGCYFKGYTLGTSSINISYGYLENCIATGAIDLSYVITNDCTWTINSSCTHDHITAENQSSTVSAAADVIVKNSDLSTDTVYTISSGTVTISYSNNRMSVQTGISDGGNNISANPQYAGTIDDLEFTLLVTSPLLGDAENRLTMGAMQYGGVLDLSGATLDNVTVGATITITSGDAGSVETAFQTLSSVRKSPIPLISNGITNNDSNILDDQTRNILLPNVYILSVTYRETTTDTVNITENYIYGLPMYKDDAGRTTADSNFNPFHISSTGDILNNPDSLAAANLVNVGQIKRTFEIYNRYDFGNCCRFDGVDQTARYAGSLINYNTVHTYMFWINIPNLALANFPLSTQQGILTQFDDPGAAGDPFCVVAIIGQTSNDPQTELRFQCQIGRGAITDASVSVDLDARTGRHLVCVSIDKPNDNMKMMVANAQEIQINTTNNANVSNPADRFDRFWIIAGGIPELDVAEDMLCNNVYLTDSQFYQLWYNGRGSYKLDDILPSASRVVHHIWDNVDTDTTILDQTSNNVDLTFTGTASSDFETFDSLIP